jgi:hypothetical protein
MLMPPFGIALVMYISCGGLLWFTGHRLAPVGYQISLGRGVWTAILITVANIFAPQLLHPFIGDWDLLVLFLLHILIVKSLMWLSFWRSVLTVTIYWIVLAAAYYVLFESPWAKGRISTSMSYPFLNV